MKTWLIDRYVMVGRLYFRMWQAAHKFMDNEEKHNYVMGFVEELVDIPFVPDFIERKLLDWAIDWVLMRLKPKYKNWYESYKPGVIPPELVMTKRKK